MNLLPLRVAPDPQDLRPISQVTVKTLMLHVTDQCNLDCSYCFVKKVPRRMTRETARRALDLFFSPDLAGSLYRPQVNFFGGEPFLELDLMEEVYDLATAPRPNNGRRPVLAVTTNGTLFGPRIQRLLREYGMQVLLSLDGDARTTGEDRPFTSGRNSYRAAAENLPRFVEAAADVMVRCTFHPGALDLRGRVEHLLGLGAPRIALCPVMDHDWEPHVARVEEAYQDLGEWVLERTGPGGIPPLEVTRRLLWDWHAATTGRPRPVRPCPVGHDLLAVDPEGNVMPCHRFLYRPGDWLGTVERPDVLSGRRRPFVEIDSSRMEECRGCAAEPVCGGGCRLVALDRGLGLHDPHPGHCIPMRAHLEMVVRLHAYLLERGWLLAALHPPRPESPEFILN